MKINMQSNLKDVAARLGAMGSRIPTVNAIALTRSAKDGQRAITDEMSKVFDRPTPYIQKSILYKKSNKHNLTAEVYIRDEAVKAVAPNKILQVEIEGGSRQLKRFEKALLAVGALPPSCST